MNEVLSSARSKRKENSPVTEKLNIPIAKRSKFIGVGGYNLRKLTNDTGVQLTTIDEHNFHMFAPNKDALAEAKEMIVEFLKDEKVPELEFGAIYKGTITQISEYGIHVQIHPQIPPVFMHNSQVDQQKVSHASALGLEIGEEINLKYFGRDPASGQMRISRKVLQAVPNTIIKGFVV